MQRGCHLGHQCPLSYGSPCNSPGTHLFCIWARALPSSRNAVFLNSRMVAFLFFSNFCSHITLSVLPFKKMSHINYHIPYNSFLSTNLALRFFIEFAITGNVISFCLPQENINYRRAGLFCSCQSYNFSVPRSLFCSS